MLTIRNARPDDLIELRRIYDAARAFMVETGNPNQWGKTNPQETTLLRHMENGDLYVVTEQERVCGVFAFIFGEDPTYGFIDGGWESDTPYAAIHCVASDGTVRGVFAACVAFCESKCSHLRIDTHKDNHIMQHCIEAHGFNHRGTIYLANGSPRMAYERIMRGGCT